MHKCFKSKNYQTDYNTTVVNEGDRRKAALLSHYRVKLLHVIQWGFDVKQLLEENQWEGHVDDVAVVESQAAQNTEQEVTLLFHFWLFGQWQKHNQDLVSFTKYSQDDEVKRTVHKLLHPQLVWVREQNCKMERQTTGKSRVILSCARIDLVLPWEGTRPKSCSRCTWTSQTRELSARQTRAGRGPLYWHLSPSCHPQIAPRKDRIISALMVNIYARRLWNPFCCL